MCRLFERKIRRFYCAGRFVMPDWNIPDVWCLSLYGNNVDIDATTGAQMISSLLEKFDLRPGRTFLKWKDTKNASHPKWKKLVSLVNENEGRELEALSLEYKPAVPETDLSRLHQFDFNNYQRYTVMSVSKFVTPNGLGDVLGVAKMLLQICRPSCGFIRSISARQSAILYSAGIPYNASTPDDRERQLQFQGALSLRHRDETNYLGQFRRKLRDVYPVNFLTSGHLARTINGVSLDAWIANRQFGLMAEMQDDIWMWQLPEEAIPAARAELLKAGALMVSD